MQLAMPTITDTKTIRALCKRAGLRLSRELGQNYLCNSSVAERLVASGEVTKDDIVVEPGAGIGALTFHIAQVARKVICVELDKKAAKILKELADGLGYKNIEIINQDILAFDPGKYDLKDREYKAVGSLPYDLAKKIIRKFIEQDQNRPSIVSVLIQREVAKEYVANPPAGAFLARYAEIYTEPKYIQTVTKQAFFPIPPVDGAIIQFKLRDEPIVPVKQVESYRTFLKLCFSAMRKTLLNTLIGYKPPSAEKALTREELTSIFNARPDSVGAVALSPSARPQELTSEQFTSLFARISGS